MSSFARTLGILCVLALVVPAASWAAGEKQAELPCADCHDTVAAAFVSNPHVHALGRDVAAGVTCTACHSGGQQHIDAEGDKTKITVPRGAEAAKTCLKCHGGQSLNDIEPASFHAQRGVNCDACHSIHGPKVLGTKLLKAPGSTLCVSCHPDVAAAFHKPNTHRMDASVGGPSNGGMQCTSCHNPHGRDGADSLRRTQAGEVVCMGCHTDKRGPFVYTHVSPVVGSCLSCHEQHGSANSMMLTRSLVAQVCLECHSPSAAGTVGSQPPSLHDLRSPRYQNCTVCHVAIHGSNASPALMK
jgi:DmsE family decaheme c-type cytochrome